LEQAINLIYRDLLRGDDRHLALDLRVDHKILASDLTDESDKVSNINVIKIDFHQPLVRAVFRWRRLTISVSGSHPFLF